MTGFARVLAVIVSFALGCMASVALWTFWTPRCMDGCTGRSGVAMVVFLAVFPALCAGLAVLLNAVRWAARVKVAVLVVALAAAGGVVLHLGDTLGSAPNPSTNPAGLR